MKKIFIPIVLIFILTSFINPPGSRELLKRMHDRYSGNWYKTFSFNQTTEIYHDDSLNRTETWYENIQFPNNFRIDFGDPGNGNAVIFKNDSSYLFRNSEKASVRPNNDDLLFLLGGMYFYPFDNVLAKMKSFGYDLNKFHEDKWKQMPVYVIGADKDGDSTNQVWIETKNLSPVRLLKYENNTKEEALFENHVKLDGGFTETLVYFYINNKLIQVEKYHDLKANVEIDPAIFDIENFVKLKL